MIPTTETSKETEIKIEDRMKAFKNEKAITTEDNNTKIIEEGEENLMLCNPNKINFNEMANSNKKEREETFKIRFQW